jgi:hypothetical protein
VILPWGLYHVAAMVLLLIGATAAAVFTATYGWLAPWWRSRAGINLFGFTASLMLALGFTAVTGIVGPFRGILLISLAVYASIAAFLIQRLTLLRVWGQIRRLAGRFGRHAKRTVQRQR